MMNLNFPICIIKIKYNTFQLIHQLLQQQQQQQKAFKLIYICN